MRRVWTFVATNSLLMVLGAVIALAWANIDPASYHALVDWPIGPVSLHWIVNDALMALFFAIAGKEVWEAVALPGGALRGARATVPLIATAGGMAGPVIVFLALAALAGPASFAALAPGWAVPTATDIAFSYMVARVIFGVGHPAISFLLLLAIADDAGGLLIIAVAYPTGELAPAWLLLSLAAALAAWGVTALPRRLDGADPARPVSSRVARLGAWPYALAGAVSWLGFLKAGVHPALGLLPVIPAIPHGALDFGPYAAEEADGSDLLNRIEHALAIPVQVILFLFGLLNAGVTVGAAGAATWVVALALILGKPLGVALAVWAATRGGLRLPEGMGAREVLVVGAVARLHRGALRGGRGLPARLRDRRGRTARCAPEHPRGPPRLGAGARPGPAAVCRGRDGRTGGRARLSAFRAQLSLPVVRGPTYGPPTAAARVLTRP